MMATGQEFSLMLTQTTQFMQVLKITGWGTTVVRRFAGHKNQMIFIVNRGMNFKIKLQKSARRQGDASIRRRISANSIGRTDPARPGMASPWALSQWARVTTAAP
jgi:hypothetical protein